MIRAYISYTKPTEQEAIAAEPDDVYFSVRVGKMWFHGTCTKEEVKLISTFLHGLQS